MIRKSGYRFSDKIMRKQSALHAFVSRSALKTGPNASISGASSLEPGEICMTICFSQIARPRPMLAWDAVAGL